MNRFWVLCVKMVYVKRVRIRNEVRCCNLIIFRKYSPPCGMFCIHHSRLCRCITFDVIILPLRIGVSFWSWKTESGFPETFPFTTLGSFDVRYYLSYFSSTTGWCNQWREKLRNNIQDVLRLFINNR